MTASRTEITPGKLVSRFGTCISEGNYAIFPVLPETAGAVLHGQCMIRKQVSDKLPYPHGISESAFDKMLDAGAGLLMLLSYAAMAGINLVAPALSDKAEKACGPNLFPYGILRQPRKAAKELWYHTPQSLRVALNG